MPTRLHCICENPTVSGHQPDCPLNPANFADHDARDPLTPDDVSDLVTQAQTAVANLRTRINALDVRVTAIEAALPPQTQTQTPPKP